MNIDQALIALCEKHDLTALKIGPSRSPRRANGYVFVAYANYEHNGVSTATQGIQPTASEAIAHAIQQVNEARACVVDVPAMELGEVVP